MSRLKDLTGMRFGRLTVIERAPNKGKQTCWKARCDCGNEVIVRGNCLKSSHTTSCGCLNREKSTVHGMCHTKIYNLWMSIKARCLSPNAKDYERYGGRDITIFPAWEDSFESFYAYVSTLEHFGDANYTLDRIDNNGNYEPGNVRWATRKEQGRNRRTNHLVEYEGETMCLKDAAELSGIDYAVLKNRVRRGDSGDKLFRPVK